MAPNLNSPEGPLPQGLPPLAHQNSGLPLLSHAPSGVPLLPRNGSGIFSTLSHQGSGIPGLSHQGSGVPLLSHQNSGIPLPPDWGVRTPPPAAGAAAVTDSAGCNAPSSAGRHERSTRHVRLSLGLAMDQAAAEQQHQQQHGAHAAAEAAEAVAAAAAVAAEGGLAPSPVGSARGHDTDPRVQSVVQQPAEPVPLDQPSPAAMLRLAAWLAVLFLGFAFQRGLCAGGIPYDCDAPSASQAFTTLSLIAFLGGGLGWLAGVTRPARFAWLAAPRRAYLWLLYLAVFPAYSGISSIPALRVSLSGLSAWGPVPILLKVLVGVLIVGVLGFHIYLAWRAGGASPALHGTAAAEAAATKPHVPAVLAPAAVAPSDSPRSNASSRSEGDSGSSLSPGSAASSMGSSGGSSPADSPCKRERRAGSASSADGRAARPAGGRAAAAAAARSARAAGSARRLRAARWRSVGLYLLPRLAVLLYFAVWLVSLPASGAYSLHLHHYALGWGLAIFAAFNHPVSGVVLALATAVFVQGAGSYGFDPMFRLVDANATGCLTVSSPPNGQMTCAFWADKPFDLGFCSNTSWVPWFDCDVAWPWPDTRVDGHADAAAANVPRALPVVGGFVAGPLIGGGPQPEGVGSNAGGPLSGGGPLTTTGGFNGVGAVGGGGPLTVINGGGPLSGVPVGG